MLNSLSLNRVAVSTAIKGAFALTLAAGVALFFHWQLFWWAILVSFLSIQPDIGSAVMMAIARFGGTCLGAVIGTLISLSFQFTWAYYPLVFIFIFCAMYYSMKPTISWAGFLCLVTGASVMVIGPKYSQGDIYYAIERCMQISFALVVVFITLTTLHAPNAHKILRAKIVALMPSYIDLWKLILESFTTGDNSNDALVQKKIRKISLALDDMTKLLLYTRYEIWKKNFSSAQCLQLIRLLRRILSLLSSLNEASRYASFKDYRSSIQDYMSKLDQHVVASIKEIATLVKSTATSFDNTIDKIEKDFQTIMDQRLASIVKKQQGMTLDDIHRSAWFSLVERLFYVFSLTRHITILMNTNKKNPQLKKKLNQEMHWLKGSKEENRWFRPVRIRAALHVAMAAAVLVWTQHYFHWSLKFSTFGIIAIAFSALSLLLPATGDIGLGIVGAILGGVYAHFALQFLQYYPHYPLVLVALYISTLFAAYLLTISKVQGKKFLVFSTYFSIVVVFALTIKPQERGSIDIVLFLVPAMLLGVISFKFISRTILPCNYRKLLQTALSKLLLHQSLLIRKLFHIKRSEKLFETMQNHFYQYTLKIGRARQYKQYCLDAGIYNQHQDDRLSQVIYSCELMILSNLIMLHPFLVLRHIEKIEDFLGSISPQFKQITRNILHYGKNIRDNQWRQSILEDVGKVKTTINNATEELVPQILKDPDYIEQIRAFSILYNGLHRLLDVQMRLLAIKDFKF